jgi:hypothetical protein
MAFGDPAGISPNTTIACSLRVGRFSGIARTVA